MENWKYNLLTLAAFLVSAIVEFFFRKGGGFTLTAFIFYGLFHLNNNGMFLLNHAHERDED